ncbi:MAG: hypothetical protein MJ061_05080 [Mailhella sp.]|nr:hypothetical protein [Mailhella sp.]
MLLSYGLAHVPSRDGAYVLKESAMRIQYDWISDEEFMMEESCDDIRIEINPPVYGHEDYFKLYDSASNTGRKLARISIWEPQYVIRQDRMERWILNDEEKKMLVSILRSVPKEAPIFRVSPPMTCWERCIYCLNWEKGLEEGDDGFIPLDLEMPDYTKL